MRRSESRLRADLLGEPDQVDEHLGRRLGVGQRAVAGPGRDAEEVGERGEADAAQPAFEQPPRERRGAERRLGKAPPVPREQLPLEEALVEARVVRDEQVVAGEGEEALEDAPRPEARRRSSSSRSPVSRAIGSGSATRGFDERLERVDELERPHAHGAELADPVARGREAGRLEVEDDELGLLEQRVGAAAGQGDGRAGADDPAVARGDLFEQRAGKPVGDRGGREERLGPPRRPTAAPRSSSVSTSRSSASSASCTRQMKANICSLGKAGLVGQQRHRDAPARRPRSTARVTAAEPNRSAHLVERGVERVAPVLVEREHELAARPSSRLLTEIPTSVMPWRSISGTATASSSSGRSEDRLRVRGRVGQRLRAGRPGGVVEAQPEHDGPAEPVRRLASGA